MQGAIRRVHLVSSDTHTLTLVIASLTPNDGDGQNENIESIALHNEGSHALKVSDFFARSRLSRLRSLDLFRNISIPSWDRLIPRTTLLTALSLKITAEFPPPPRLTAAQLFSILTSNPNLQEPFLTRDIFTNDPETSTSKVQLCYLKELSLAGGFRHLFGLLRQLTPPEMLDQLYLTVFDPTVEDVFRTLVPYMRDYFRHDPRFQDRLGVTASSTDRSVSVSVSVVGAPTAKPSPGLPVVSLRVFTAPNMLEQFLPGLIAHIPREQVVCLVGFKPDMHEELFSTMPNVETLRISNVELSGGFLQPNPNGPRANTKLFPLLRFFSLQGLTLRDNNWVT